MLAIPHSYPPTFLSQDRKTFKRIDECVYNVRYPLLPWPFFYLIMKFSSVKDLANLKASILLPFIWPRSNEFGTITARYCDMKPQYCKPWIWRFNWIGQKRPNIHCPAKTWIYLTPYVCTEGIFDSRPFMYNKIFLKKLL